MSEVIPMAMSLSQKKKILIILAVVGISILVLGIMAIYMINQGEKCVANPLTYGLETIYQKDNVETYCTCYILDGSYAPFEFNRFNVTPRK